jgi:hypothetical protein
MIDTVSVYCDMRTHVYGLGAALCCDVQSMRQKQQRT